MHMGQQALPKWWKIESISTEIRNKTRVPTLTKAFIMTVVFNLGGGLPFKKIVMLSVPGPGIDWDAELDIVILLVVEKFPES